MSNEDETLFEFPCEFPLKVMGRNNDDFIATVNRIANIHVECFDNGCVAMRESGGGKFLSITITFEAQSKDHVDNFYRELHAHEHVLMLL